MSEQGEYTEYRIVGETHEGKAWEHGTPDADLKAVEKRAERLAEGEYNRRVAIEARTWTATPWGIATEVRL